MSVDTATVAKIAALARIRMEDEQGQSIFGDIDQQVAQYQPS